MANNRTEQNKKTCNTDIRSHGEPYMWAMGGALVFGVMLVLSLLVFVLYNGVTTFKPSPIYEFVRNDGRQFWGEIRKTEQYKVPKHERSKLDESWQKRLEKSDGFARRYLLRIGNFDLYNEDFVWVSEFEIKSKSKPEGILFVERMEWGPFIGKLKPGSSYAESIEKLQRDLDDATIRRKEIHRIESENIADINHHMEEARLSLKKDKLAYGEESKEFLESGMVFKEKIGVLERQYAKLFEEAKALKNIDSKHQVTLVDVDGREKTLLMSHIVRLYAANDLGPLERAGIYASRWIEFLTQDPREANTEGGVFPAIFGTVVMTLIMALIVAPFGVIAALYLKEYAKQGKLVSAIRICVNNLAGVPSIVYGVFGLGFFGYLLGGRIDQLFYPERLPSPTFGTGGLMWASLTLALLTVPVVIVATEEALTSIPNSLREGALACGASKWQALQTIVIPRALPGIMTGLILAMARGAGEVAPLMLVGVVKLAPELPIDGEFPFVHLERSFMHLGFHIFDVGFQSRNSEAGKPMVFVTTLLLISIVFFMNTFAIYFRNRLRRRFAVGGQF